MFKALFILLILTAICIMEVVIVAWCIKRAIVKFNEKKYFLTGTYFVIAVCNLVPILKILL